MQLFTLSDVFPASSSVFLLSQPYYGSQAEVIGHADGRIKVQLDSAVEPDLARAISFSVSSLRPASVYTTLRFDLNHCCPKPGIFYRLNF